MARWREVVESRRELIGRFLFEFVIIVVGVTVAFALENARQEREQARGLRRQLSALN